MSRTIDASITSNLQGRVIKPAWRFVSQNELLSFSAPVFTATSQDTDIPVSVIHGTSNTVYVWWRVGATSYLRAMNHTTAANWALSTASVSSWTSRALRDGVAYVGGLPYVYRATDVSTTIQIQRSSLAGTGNPQAITFNNYGSAIPLAFTDTATFVRRVEAVCPADNGSVIVLIGEHDFTNQLSTITFWLVESGRTCRLAGFEQVALTATYSNWRAHQRHFASAHALYNAVTNVVQVFYTLGKPGEAQGRMFSMRNGVDSEPRNIIPLDDLSKAVYFQPTSSITINGLYYLCGRVRYPNGDSTETAYDGFLMSADCDNWSFGELSHVIQTEKALGALMFDPGAGVVTLYYAGNGYHTSAAATPVQTASATGKQITLSSRVSGATHEQGVNAADSFSATFRNADNVLFKNSLLKRGCRIVVDIGIQGGGVWSRWGEFLVDSVSPGVTARRGIQALQVNARDAGMKLLNTKTFPCVLNLKTRVADKRAFATTQSGEPPLEGMSVRTPEDRQYSFGENGLLHEGLNAPLVLTLDRPAPYDFIQRARMSFNGDNAYHQSIIAFMLGITEDGIGNLVAVPKGIPSYSHATTISKPRLRKMSLVAVDPDDSGKEGTGWEFREGVDSLVMNVDNEARTADAGGTYLRDASTALNPGVRTDVAVRISGRRVQVYTRPVDLSPANCASTAMQTLYTNIDLPYSLRRTPEGVVFGGLAVSTDVWHSTTVMAGLTEKVLANGLSQVYEDQNMSRALTSSGIRGALDYEVVGCTDTSKLSVGMHIKVNVDGLMHRIISIVANSSYRVTPSFLAGINAPITAYGADANDIWGWISSRNYKKVVGGDNVFVDTGARRMGKRVGGKIMVIDRTHTAAFTRYYLGDGIKWTAYSGSISSVNGGSYLLFDSLTNPKPSTMLGHSGSQPSDWQIFGNPGFLFLGLPASLGFESMPYFRAGKPDDKESCEVIWAEGVTFSKKGVYPGDAANNTTWTQVRSYYAPAEASAEGSGTLEQWVNSSNIMPGDNLGTISSPAGLLAVIVTPNENSDNDGAKEESARYYVTGVTNQPSPTPGNGSTVTLDRPYPNAVSGTGVDANNAGDVIALLGRGIDNTPFTTHSENDPFTYYPRNSAGDGFANTLVERYALHGGIYMSLEDAIKRLAALGGSRKIYFRNALASPYEKTAISQVLSTSWYSVPLAENLTDFVLDLDAHLPGYGMGTGNYKGRIEIECRGYYVIAIGQYNTEFDMQDNRFGGIRVDLITQMDTANGGVDVGGDDSSRYLRSVHVPFADANLSGSTSGSGVNWTHTENTALRNRIRVAVIGTDIVIEIDGRHVWTFDLDELIDGDYNYKRLTPGPMRIRVTQAAAGATATIRLMELAAEVPNDVQISPGTDLMSVVEEVIGGRRVISHAKADGGAEWSTYLWSRDELGTVRHNLHSRTWSESEDKGVTHQKVVGVENAASSALDMTRIRADGYKVGMIENEMFKTTGQTDIESRLVLRDDAEFGEQEDVAAFGDPRFETEDGLSLTYSGGGGVPAGAAENKVVSGLSWTIGKSSLRAVQHLRKRL